MDIGKLLQSVLGSDAATAISGEAKRLSGGGGLPQGAVGGAAAGGLMMMLLGSKKARKMGGKALNYGGAALLAGLAYKAYTDYKSQKPAQQTADADFLAAPPAGSGFSLDDRVEAGGADFRLAVVRAMIASAKSDGHVDDAENARIRQAIGEQNLSAEEKGALLDAFSQEADPVAIAELARTEQQGIELYAASRLAVDPDNAAEQRYLDRLAGALRLPQALVDQLDAKVEGARRQIGALDE